MQALRRGWYLGEQSFKDKLLGFMDKAQAKVLKKASHSGGAVRARNEMEAERIITVVGAALGMPTDRSELMLMKKGDRNKVICAAIARSNTAVANDWLSERLAMGHSAHPIRHGAGR